MAEEKNDLQKKSKLVIVLSKGTLDAAYPALIIATSGVSLGMDVYMYFTFGGMKFLTEGESEQVGPSKDLGLTKEQLESLTAKGGMPSVQQMLKMAADMGVHINACSPTMKLFGTTEKNLILKDTNVVGATTFLGWASDPTAITLFI
ncbi:MAG: DsrE/DsrF/DrsH-like family protein [Candidatus Thermoplasmatota archaeon]|nr:DsrE/DsrF/DrsH-like family protein [Candidatus Thermoplasmatota archaeon]MCL5889119.1 DsrE/DsrF/DrsH-like family protein [Candidatus Thermoplasmatota archaeon]